MPSSSTLNTQKTHLLEEGLGGGFHALSAQVKELGVLVTDCPCLAADMAKIFEVYWALGGEGKSVPERYVCTE